MSLFVSPKNLDRYSEPSYGGEILVELKQDPIAGTFYRFPIFETDYGYQSVSYSIYTRFDDKFNSKERVTNRSITTVWSDWFFWSNFTFL